jgi:hypothetical protein
VGLVVESVVSAAIDVVDAGCAGTEEEVVVEVTLVLVEDVLLVLRTDVVNKERSVCWNATVMGCAHMVIRPDTVVNVPSIPSSEDVISSSPSSAANTVVTPEPVKMLVHP